MHGATHHVTETIYYISKPLDVSYTYLNSLFVMTREFILPTVSHLSFQLVKVRTKNKYVAKNVYFKTRF